MHLHLIKKPVMTEKSAHFAGDRKYGFYVSMDANKKTVMRAIQEAYGVTPASVNMLRTAIKTTGQGRIKRREQKKAIVTLKKGDTLDTAKFKS